MNTVLALQEAKQIIVHWLNTPVNGYYGQSYGADLNSLLLQPMTARTADQLLAKLKRDIPLLSNLNSDQLSVRELVLGHDKKQLFIALGDVYIPLEKTNIITSGETYNANAQ